MKIAWAWVHQIPQNFLSQQLNISESTISYHYNRISIATQIWLESNKITIGGDNHIVEVDETQISKYKQHCGRIVPGSSIWIFGGVDRQRKCCELTIYSSRTNICLATIRQRNLWCLKETSSERI